MDDAERDRRFAELLGAVIERHAIASRLQATVDLAERTLGDALRIGDAVRRALRSDGGARPDADDCRRLEDLAAALETASDAALAAPEAIALRRAAAAEDPVGAARLALELFAGLTRPAAIPAAVYVPITARRRARTGETLVHPATLAGEIRRTCDDGLRPASGAAPDPSEEEGPVLPEPIALAPSFAGSGSEIAFRRATSDLEDALLEDAASGDLVVFSDRIAGPFSIILAEEPEDEWWAAGTTAYASYRAELIELLTQLGIEARVDR